MNYLQDFTDYLRFNLALSDNTIRSYDFDLKEFLEYLRGKGIDPTVAKVKDIDGYLSFIRRENGVSASTASRRIYTLKGFYRWLERIELVVKNPMSFFRNIKAPKPLPKYLTEQQQQALLEASKGEPGQTDWIRQRNKLMILVFLGTGLRVSELCTIEISNLNLNQGILKVMGKGNKEREVVLSDVVIDATRGYLASLDTLPNGTVGPAIPGRGQTMAAVCKRLGFPQSSAYMGSKHPEQTEAILEYVKTEILPVPIRFLFFNQGGRHLNTRHVFRILTEMGTKAGIPGMHPHLLRHTFATNLRRKRADLLLIKEALGHSSVATTQIYAHLGETEYRDQLRELLN